MNYFRNECYEGCPHNSHCEYSFCECNYGYIKRWGRCESDWGQNPGSRQQEYRPQSFDPFKTCNSAADCMNMDMNLICNKELTTGGNVGKCECRRDMKWNTEALECQVNSSSAQPLKIFIHFSRSTWMLTAQNLRMTPNLLQLSEQQSMKQQMKWKVCPKLEKVLCSTKQRLRRRP